MGRLDELLFEHGRNHPGEDEPICVFCDIERIADAVEDLADVAMSWNQREEN